MDCLKNMDNSIVQRMPSRTNGAIVQDWMASEVKDTKAVNVAIRASGHVQRIK